jgi:hypothetical protein
VDDESISAVQNVRDELARRNLLELRSTLVDISQVGEKVTKYLSEYTLSCSERLINATSILPCELEAPPV